MYIIKFLNTQNNIIYYFVLNEHLKFVRQNATKNKWSMTEKKNQNIPR